MLKQLLPGFILAVVMASASVAGPLEDAGAAYEWGDYAKAQTILRPLAEQGDAGAQNKLGFMYADGLAVPQDYAEAVRWYRKAADQGYPDGQNSLAFMYVTGRGVPQDHAEALKWYRLAAEQGLAEAQNSVGFILALGKTAPQDYVAAYQWFSLAAAQGDKAAAQNRDHAATLMTPDQIAEAERLVREWKPKAKQ